VKLRDITIRYMSDERPPARPWFDLVMERIAVRGWGIAELSRHAKVGRPTIYGWRDSANGKLQADPVNRVADALGIPRERALRLAGIITTRTPEPPPIPDSLIREIDAAGLTGEARAKVIALLEAELATGDGSSESSGTESLPEGAYPCRCARASPRLPCGPGLTSTRPQSAPSRRRPPGCRPGLARLLRSTIWPLWPASTLRPR
jgi:hypothetical protein